MNKQTEALKLALKALESCSAGDYSTGHVIHPSFDVDAVNKAIDAVDEALAEQPAQQQEPVVWMYVNKSTHETKFQKHMRAFVDHGLWAEVPLYGEPLANHELQCVCGAVWCGDEMVHLPDKRPPASKPWVGLTDEEVDECYYWKDRLWTTDEMVRHVESKLREKNA